VFGSWPIATNTASTAISDFSPVFTSRRRRPVTKSLAEHLVDLSVPHEVDLPVRLSARSCMIFEARSSVAAMDDRHLAREAVRNSASSIAVSPPPTTAISLPR
jgi:hypothetical protein